MKAMADTERVAWQPPLTEIIAFLYFANDYLWRIRRTDAALTPELVVAASVAIDTLLQHAALTEEREYW